MRAKRLGSASRTWITLGALALLSALTAGAVAIDTPRGALRDDARATLSVLALDAETGRPLAARARISARLSLQDERVLVDRDGALTSQLPPGHYHLAVSHGPEFSIYERDVTLEPGARVSLRASLRREVDASEYTACDLHVHSDESPDSDLALAARIDTLLAEDVHFAVLTNHNAITDASEALSMVGIGTFPGLEVTTWAPELGHFNVFPRATVPEYRHTTPHELLRELRKDGESFVQLNHPRLEGHIGYFELSSFDRSRGHGDRGYPLGFDAIEVWNGYDLAEDARREEVFLDWLALVSRGQHITATGNSDSHKAGRLPFVGYPRTYVRVPRREARRADAVLGALKAGRAFVSNGPIIELRVHGRGPGDTVRVARDARSLDVDVEARAPAWMELSELTLWLGSEQVARVSLGAHGERARVSLPLAGQRSLVATVRGKASMKRLVGRSRVTPYAFTNPVWIERR